MAASPVGFLIILLLLSPVKSQSCMQASEGCIIETELLINSHKGIFEIFTFCEISLAFFVEYVFECTDTPFGGYKDLDFNSYFDEFSEKIIQNIPEVEKTNKISEKLKSLRKKDLVKVMTECGMIWANTP